MRQLLPPDPGAGPVDLTAAYVTPDRPSPPDRPWVLAGMIASADGGATVDGASGGLGGPGDRATFRAVRAAADVVLVGAGTVRAERYRPARPAEEHVAARRARGQADAPRIAVVTASASLDADLPLFEDPQHPPLVLTTGAAPEERRAALAEVAEVVEVADGPRVPPDAALAVLRARDASVVLCEGGPRLLGQVVVAGLLDELCLTLAPTLLAGEAARIATDPSSATRSMELAHVLEEDGYLFLRYVRADGAGG